MSCAGKALFVFATVLTALANQAAVAELTMGVFPRRGASDTVVAFAPLQDHLASILEEKVELRVFKDFDAFEKALAARELDIVHLNQMHYVEGKAFGYRVFARNIEHGSDMIVGALIVRKDSPYKSVEDLKGKKIVFGGNSKAMQSYIAPSYLLRKAGLKEGVDYSFEFAKNPPSALLAVAVGAADAAGGATVLLRFREVQPVAGDLRILAATDPLVQLSWAAGERVTHDKLALILTAMENAPASVRTAAKVDGWKKTDDSEYAAVRRLVELVTGNVYR